MKEKGAGWILFSWVVLMTMGVMTALNGIIALGNSSFWDDFSHYVVFSNLNTWGWIALILGVIEILAALSVWKGGGFGRWVGIAIASIALVHWLFWVPIVPFWALIASTMAVLVIYGLAVYGDQGIEG